MPNWCSNSLTVSGDSGLLENFFLTGCSVDGTGNAMPLSFACFVPAPEGVDWYDWNINNWGTKWDLRADTSFSGVFLRPGQTEAELHYNFETAWSPPVAWLSRVSDLYPELDFQLSYMEPGMAYKGEATASGGNFEDNTEEMSPEDFHEQDVHDDIPQIGCSQCGPDDFSDFHEINAHGLPDDTDSGCTVCQHLLGQHATLDRQCPLC